MSVAWSWAFDTPFKWTKQVASHFGGTRQGMAMAWPDRIKDAGGIRTQFHHMIDIVPTILEATGIQAPVMVNGIAQKPIEGVSMAYTFDKANANAPSTRTTQYFEMFGNRAIYHDGWIAATTPPAPPWLMGTGQDARRGQRLQVGTLQHRRGLLGEQRPRGQDARQAARAAGAVPGGGGEVQRVPAGQLGRSQRIVAPRPSATAGRNVFTYSGEMSGLPEQRRAEHPEQVLHHHRRGRRFPQGGGGGHDRHAGRPLRRLRPLPAQGQAGVHLQLPRPRALPLGRPGGAHARASTPSCSTSPTTAPASARAAPAC